MCRLVADPIAGTISETDLSKVDPKWKCVQVSTLEDIAKAGYWLWKTYQWLAEIP